MAVGEDYVELRRILVTFSLHLNRPLTEDDSDDEEMVLDFDYLNLDEIRRALCARCALSCRHWRWCCSPLR